MASESVRDGREMENFPFRPAVIPESQGGLEAEILDVDDGSYFHIVIKEPSVMEDYKNLEKKMIELACARIPAWTLPGMEPGMLCVLEYKSRLGGVYVRGKIIQLLPERSSVRCELVDDILEVDLHCSQVFPVPASHEIFRFPKFSLKCTLADMECFQGFPHLKVLYKESMKEEWKPEARTFTVNILDKDSLVPTVRIINYVGEDLTDRFQQLIPKVLRPVYPESGLPVKARIMHYDEEKLVWFQVWNEEGGLVQVVESKFHSLESGKILFKSEEREPLPVDSWKNKYLSGPNEVFVFQRENESKYYRVRVLSNNDDGALLVKFMDHGQVELVGKHLLKPAKLLDPNLCYIPPLCLPFRLVAKQEESEASMLWKLSEEVYEQVVSLVFYDEPLGDEEGNFYDAQGVSTFLFPGASSLLVSPQVRTPHCCWTLPPVQVPAGSSEEEGDGSLTSSNFPEGSLTTNWVDSVMAGIETNSSDDEESSPESPSDTDEDSRSVDLNNNYMHVDLNNNDYMEVVALD